MSSSPKTPSNRLFQRVQFEGAGAVHELFGAKVTWANGEVSAVFDMSYSGVAMTRPTSMELKVCHKYPLKFKLGQFDVCEVLGEVMWFNDTITGIAFDPLDAKARLAFNEFLDDKLIGANLHEISPDLFSSIMDCTHWYQGPKDTNVYLWMIKVGDDVRVERAIVELDDFFLRFEDGRVVEVAGGASEGGVHSKYAEITDEVSVKQLAQKELDFVTRVVGVLGQINAQKDPIQKLIVELAKDYLP